MAFKKCALCDRPMGALAPPSKKDKGLCNICDQQGLSRPEKADEAPKKPALKKKVVAKK